MPDARGDGGPGGAGCGAGDWDIEVEEDFVSIDKIVFHLFSFLVYLTLLLLGKGRALGSGRPFLFKDIITGKDRITY